MPHQLTGAVGGLLGEDVGEQHQIERRTVGGRGSRRRRTRSGPRIQFPPARLPLSRRLAGVSRTTAESCGFAAHRAFAKWPHPPPTSSIREAPSRSRTAATRRAIWAPIARMAAPKRAVSSGVLCATGQSSPRNHGSRGRPPALVHRVRMLEKWHHVAVAGAEVRGQVLGRAVSIAVGIGDPESGERPHHLGGSERVESEAPRAAISGVTGRSASNRRMPVRPATVMMRWLAKPHKRRWKSSRSRSESGMSPPTGCVGPTIASANNDEGIPYNPGSFGGRRPPSDLPEGEFHAPLCPHHPDRWRTVVCGRGRRAQLMCDMAEATRCIRHPDHIRLRRQYSDRCQEGRRCPAFEHAGGRSFPRFSPDGALIGFTNYDGNQDIFVIPVGGGSVAVTVVFKTEPPLCIDLATEPPQAVEVKVITDRAFLRPARRSSSGG